MNIAIGLLDHAERHENYFHLTGQQARYWREFCSTCEREVILVDLGDIPPFAIRWWDLGRSLVVEYLG